jgi:predicted FMN-binding regulatory protein PaiB
MYTLIVTLDVLFAAIDRQVARKKDHFARKEIVFTAKGGSIGRLAAHFAAKNGHRERLRVYFAVMTVAHAAM